MFQRVGDDAPPNPCLRAIEAPVDGSLTFSRAEGVGASVTAPT